MKKFYSTIFAMMAAAGIMYGAQVESINTVGMLEYGGDTQFELCGNPFINEGTDGAENTLGDIIVNDSFEFLSDSIIVFNNLGNQIFTATYVNEELAEEMDVAAGWYDFDDIMSEDEIYTLVNDYKIPYGCSVALSKANDSAGLIFAGEVKKSASIVTGTGSFDLVSNPHPKNVLLGDVSVNESFEFLSDTVIIFQNGYVLFTATYVNEASAEEFGVDPGWYDFDDIISEDEIFTSKDDFSIPSGFGFVLSRANADASLIFPGVE